MEYRNLPGCSLVTMLQRLQKIMNPAWYQGPKNNRAHFEGWYFKIISGDERRKYAIIPGIYLGPDKERHSFIQVFDGVKNETHYIRFPVEQFQARNKSFDLCIGPNLFSTNRIKMDVHSSSLSMKGVLQFTDTVPWPKSLISPGIMGWYSWIPFMECYHGIVSLDHTINGTLEINGETIDFNNGKGYSEKDWGQSFPEAWIWCQCNHFQSPQSSLTGSVAIIPWINRPFPGFIFGLWHDQKLYRFTTYNHARLVRFTPDTDKVTLTLAKGPYQLHLVAHQSDGGILQAPTLKGMSHSISESLSSTIEVTLTQQTGHTNKILFQDTGRHAGYENAGNIERLQSMYHQINKGQA